MMINFGIENFRDLKFWFALNKDWRWQSWYSARDGT